MRPGLDATGKAIVTAATQHIVDHLQAKGEVIGDKGRGRIERDVIGFMHWFVESYASEGPAMEELARRMLVGAIETKGHFASVVIGGMKP